MIAPATADLLAQLAHGLADDFSNHHCISRSPDRVVLAPAMNSNMWMHPATQENAAVLRQRGHVIVEPEEGLLACGMIGPGRLAEPDKIANVVAGLGAGLNYRARDLEGETVLITAGPTQEPLDPVRYISNRSSGKMGYALAEAARRTRRSRDPGFWTGGIASRRGTCEVMHVRTAREMRDAVMEHLPEASIIVKAAAVADYHLSQVPRNKVKKTAMRMSLDLDPTPDILAELGKKKGDRLLIGFAAETENLVDSARQQASNRKIATWWLPIW